MFFQPHTVSRTQGTWEHSVKTRRSHLNTSVPHSPLNSEVLRGGSQHCDLPRQSEKMKIYGLINFVEWKSNPRPSCLQSHPGRGTSESLKTGLVVGLASVKTLRSSLSGEFFFWMHCVLRGGSQCHALPRNLSEEMKIYILINNQKIKLKEN